MLRANVARRLFRGCLAQATEGEFRVSVGLAESPDAAKETGLSGACQRRDEVLVQSAMTVRANAIGEPLQIVIANVLVMAEGAGDRRVHRSLRVVMYRARMAGQTRLARDRVNVTFEVEFHEPFERSPVGVTLRTIVGEELVGVREFAAFEDVILANGPLKCQPTEAANREPKRRPPSPPPKTVGVLLGVLFDSSGKFATGEEDGHGVWQLRVEC